MKDFDHCPWCASKLAGGADESAENFKFWTFDCGAQIVYYRDLDEAVPAKPCGTMEVIARAAIKTAGDLGVKLRASADGAPEAKRGHQTWGGHPGGLRSPALRASGGVTGAMVERAAQGIYEVSPRTFDGEDIPWSDLSEGWKPRYRDFARAALESAALSAEWRAISEAPKGVKVLGGFYNEAGKWRTVLARYYEAGTLETSSDFDFDPDVGHYAPAGWYEESETAEEIQPIGALTHWLPLSSLPSPPEKSDEGDR